MSVHIYSLPALLTSALYQRVWEIKTYISSTSLPVVFPCRFNQRKALKHKERGEERRKHSSFGSRLSGSRLNRLLWWQWCWRGQAREHPFHESGGRDGLVVTMPTLVMIAADDLVRRVRVVVASHSSLYLNDTSLCLGAGSCSPLCLVLLVIK